VEVAPLRVGGPDGERRILLLPGAGGNALPFAHLGRALAPDVALAVLQSRYGNEEGPTPGALTARYVRALREVQPAGPYRLAGYCFGRHAALAMAAALRRAGDEVRLVTIIEHMPGRELEAPELPPGETVGEVLEAVARSMAEPSDDAMAQADPRFLAAAGVLGVPAAVLHASTAFSRQLVATAAANYRIWAGAQTLACSAPLRLIVAHGAGGGERAELLTQQWRRTTAFAGVTFVTESADEHILRPPLVSELARLLIEST
jgi:thioesterase domain-containing protein